MLRKCWYVQDMALSVIATLRKDGWGVLGVWGGGLRFAVVCFMKALSRWKCCFVYSQLQSWLELLFSLFLFYFKYFNRLSLEDLEVPSTESHRDEIRGPQNTSVGMKNKSNAFRLQNFGHGRPRHFFGKMLHIVLLFSMNRYGAIMCHRLKHEFQWELKERSILFKNCLKRTFSEHIHAICMS